jgi:hypothetical protein
MINSKGEIMGEKDDVKRTSEKAKGYMEKGFN